MLTFLDYEQQNELIHLNECFIIHCFDTIGTTEVRNLEKQPWIYV